jgi:hypothetical protein
MKKNNKKTYVVILAVIVAISMVVSILSVVVDNQQNDLTYNKYTFQVVTLNDGQYYRTKINDKMMDFTYFPSELEDINISSSIVTQLQQAQAIAFVFDPSIDKDNLVYADYARYDMQNKLTVPMIFGVTNSSDTYALPILDCVNATSGIPFLKLNISVERSIVTDQNYPNCIIMNAKLKDIIALKDRITYTIYGVMK